MDSARVVAVIPARYGSTRFPGKPLTPIHGKPMVVHVVDRVLEAGCCDQVVVATDDERIAAAVEGSGASSVMTGEASSGTDRVAQAVQHVAGEVILNVQGDEPALPPEDVATLAQFLAAHPEAPMATLAAPATDDDLDNPNVVKVVCDTTGCALYFSRAAIPFPRTRVAGLARRHVGMYGFQREALFRFNSLPEHPLERAEGLEQLRALANGLAIHVLPGSGGSVAVDVPADVVVAEAAVSALTERKTPAAGGRGSGGSA